MQSTSSSSSKKKGLIISPNNLNNAEARPPKITIQINNVRSKTNFVGMPANSTLFPPQKKKKEEEKK